MRNQAVLRPNRLGIASFSLSMIALVLWAMLLVFLLAFPRSTLDLETMRILLGVAVALGVLGASFGIASIRDKDSSKTLPLLAIIFGIVMLLMIGFTFFQTPSRR